MRVQIPWFLMTRGEKVAVFAVLFLQLCAALLPPVAIIALIVWLLR